MNPLDIGIVVIIGFCLIRGLFRGLIKEVSSIIGVVAGFYTALTFYKPLSEILKQWISNPSYNNIISFMILFCAVIIAVSIIAVILKYLLNIAFLGWLDRICGALFGTAKALLIVSVILLALTSFLEKGSPIIKTSILSPYVMFVSENLSSIIPDDMKKGFEDNLKMIRKAWQDHSKKAIKPQIPS